MNELSIYIINYNGEKVLRETIQSLKNQDYPINRITLIDDCSTDKSIDLVRKEFPDVEIIGMSYNTGLPNKLRKMAVDSARSRYIFLADNDIVFEKNCLTKLMDTMKSSLDIGLCTPRLMYYDTRERIYVCWTKFHYLAVSISPLRDTYSVPESIPIDTLGGGTMLLDKEKIDIIGSIDDSYPMGWGEDAEIYARMKIAGFRTLYVPSAVGYHHAKEFVKKRIARPFGQARNRWFMILSMYQLKTIILIMPALLLYDGLTFLMLIPKKMANSYLKGILSAIKNIGIIHNKRKQIQLTRKSKDKDILTSGLIHMPQAYLSNPLIKFAFNYLRMIFHLYWQLIKIFL